MNTEKLVILKFIRYPGLILAEREHCRGIGAIYAVPTRGAILYDKTPRLNYDGPISVEKQEGLVDAICNYLTRHISNVLGYHEDTIYYIEFVYAIVLDCYNYTFEDVLAHDFVDLTLDLNGLKYLVVGLILLHTEIIFNGDIKLQSIVQFGIS